MQKEEIYADRFTETDSTDGFYITPVYELTLKAEILEAMEQYASQFQSPQSKDVEKQIVLALNELLWAAHNKENPAIEFDAIVSLRNKIANNEWGKLSDNDKQKSHE